MTVTFSPTFTHAGVFCLIDCAGGRSTEVYPSYAEAVDAAVTANAEGTVLPGCTDPEIHQWDPCPVMTHALTTDEVAGFDAPRTNVSNAHAGSLVTVLGYDCEDALGGSESAQTFLARVEQALSSSASAAGEYARARLEELREIAQWALAHDRRVQWA